jgi:membrane protein DedA with SNARE-associated domain
VLHFIAQNGYIAIFILMLAESACIPVPSELVMPLGGALAAGAVAGSHPSLALVIVTGTLGNVAGSYLAWAVGRYGAEASLHRWGRLIWLRQDHIDRAHRWFERRGPIAVLVGRVVPVVRTFISLPAGVARMRPLPFGLYTLVGCVPWSAGLAVAGYELGRNWHTAENDVQAAGDVIVALILVLAVVLVILWRRRRRARVAATVAETPEVKQAL